MNDVSSPIETSLTTATHFITTASIILELEWRTYIYSRTPHTAHSTQHTAHNTRTIYVYLLSTMV